MRSRAHIAGHLIAPLLVVLWAVQCLLAFQHSAEHTHRYCPAHSAFEEAPASRELARAPRSGDGSAVEKRGAQASEAAGHEVCAFLAFGERQAVVGGGTCARVLLPVVPEHAPAVLASPRAWSPLSVLDTAPKASPPARA